MSDTAYDVQLLGDIAPGEDRQRVCERLAALLELSLQEAEVLLADQPVTLASGLEQRVADQYCQRLAATGARCQVVAVPAEPEPAEAAPAPPVTLAPPRSPAAAPAGPYRRVPTQHGWRWFSEGLRWYQQNPSAWMSMGFFWGAVTSTLSMLPLFTFFAYVLSPIFSAGFMMSCHRHRRGETPQLAQLFSGFQLRFASLIRLGLLYFVSVLLAGILIMAFFSAPLSSLETDANGALAGGWQTLSGGQLMQIFLAMLFSVLLVWLVGLMFWFAPALIILRGATAMEALRLSTKAALLNWRPFVLFGLVITLLGFVALLPALLFGLLIGPGGIFIASVLGFLGGVLLFLPLSTLACYHSFWDVFYPTLHPDQEQSPQERSLL